MTSVEKTDLCSVSSFFLALGDIFQVQPLKEAMGEIVIITYMYALSEEYRVNIIQLCII